MNFQSYFDKGLSLNEYIEMTERLLEKGKTTGPNQSDVMIQYTKLNLQRSKRWMKKGKVSFPEDEYTSNVSQQKWLVISEPWCGDAAHGLPFFQKIADELKISMRIVLRDENEDLMNAFLTNSGKSIPKLISFKDEEELVFDWGPRPQQLQEWFLVAKREKKDYEEIFNYLQNFYNKDAGRSTISEITECIIKSHK